MHWVPILATKSYRANSQDSSHGQEAQFHAGLPRSFRDQHLRPSRQLGVPTDQVDDTRAIHVRSSGNTREVPKRLQNPKRRTIGLRVPDHALVHAVLDELGEPIMSSTLTLPGDEMPLTDPLEIEERIGHEIDAIVDAGPTGFEPTTVLDLTGGVVEVLRAGRGDVSALL